VIISGCVSLKFVLTWPSRNWHARGICRYGI